MNGEDAEERGHLEKGNGGDSLPWISCLGEEQTKANYLCLSYNKLLYNIILSC